MLYVPIVNRMNLIMIYKTFIVNIGYNETYLLATINPIRNEALESSAIY